jgi:hemerythrin-like metal-binding protein
LAPQDWIFGVIFAGAKDFDEPIPVTRVARDCNNQETRNLTMALIDWSDNFSVGVQLMDDHHKKLFDIFNRLHAAMKAGQGDTVLDGIMKELIDYTRYHFGEEEKMLERVGYTQMEMHKGLHRKFVAELEGYEKDISGGMAVFAATQVMNSSLVWLRDHIMTIDKGYTSLVKQAGIS